MLPQCKRGQQLAAQMVILRQARLGHRMAVDRTPVVTQKKPASIAYVLKEPQVLGLTGVGVSSA